MRSAFLDDAEPETVSHTLRSVIGARGGLVTEHRHSRVRFTGIKPHALSWTRAGYVGIYQHLGERETEVRLVLRARWPWRILLTVCAINVGLLITAIVLNAAASFWMMAAILGGLAIVIAGVLHVGTLKSVHAEEADLMEAFEGALRELPSVDVEAQDARELRDLEAELEGEITRRAIDAQRPPRPKGGRFNLFPAKKDAATPPAETADERRARLLARKAELEARKRDRAPPE